MEKINYNDRAVIDFYVLLHAAYFGFFCSHHVSVFSNLSSAEKASVKDEGRLLTDCAYEALTLWVCMFLKFLKCKFYLYLIWGYWLQTVFKGYQQTTVIIK